MSTTKTSADYYDEGYEEGYEYGYNKGQDIGYQNGYEVGFREGHKKGYEKGKVAGYHKGKHDGRHYIKELLKDNFIVSTENIWIIGALTISSAIGVTIVYVVSSFYKSV